MKKLAERRMVVPIRFVSEVVAGVLDEMMLVEGESTRLAVVPDPQQRAQEQQGRAPASSGPREIRPNLSVRFPGTSIEACGISP